ncbi:MAG TPA: hypothetical protein V6C63_17230 [Allocoleopsis sp.]
MGTGTSQMAIANREEVFSHHIVDAFESGAIAQDYSKRVGQSPSDSFRQLQPGCIVELQSGDYTCKVEQVNHREFSIVA